MAKSIYLLISAFLTLILLFDLKGSSTGKNVFCCEPFSQSSSENNCECSLDENLGRVGKSVCQARQFNKNVINSLRVFTHVKKPAIPRFSISCLDKYNSLQSISLTACSVLRI